jgi:hypothetical protein
MRRISKREQMVTDALAEAARHAAMPFKVVSPDGVRRLRNRAFFIPAYRYGRYWVVQRGELGRCGDFRYKIHTRKTDK